MASRNITVNAVAPGIHRNRHDRGVVGRTERRRCSRTIPLKRLGKPEDVAAAVRFLASEEAGYITGHVLNVNGGMYM